MEKLIEHLNLGPHDVTTIDTTAYLLPSQIHEQFYHKGDTFMSSEPVCNISSEMNINDGMGNVMNQCSSSSSGTSTSCRNQRKDHTRSNRKRGKRRQKRMDIIDKTLPIRRNRMSNNIQKKLERSQRRKYKEEKEKSIRKKRQLKVKMRIVQKGVAMFHL